MAAGKMNIPRLITLTAMIFAVMRQVMKTAVIITSRYEIFISYIQWWRRKKYSMPVTIITQTTNIRMKE